MDSSPLRITRSLTIGIALALLGLAAAYLLYRACVLQVEYYDGFCYLQFSQRLLGNRDVSVEVTRPPGLAVLMLPAVKLALAGGPANRWLLIAPHLAGALLALASLLAAFLAFRQGIRTPAALLAVVLFAASRWFVRYGAFAMADLPAAGLCAAAVAAFLRARELGRRSWILYLLAGGAAGMAIATKPSAVLLPIALVLSELVVTVFWPAAPGARWRRLAGVAVVAGLALAVAAAVYWVAFRRMFPAPVWPRALAAIRVASKPRIMAGESRLDHLEMLLTMIPQPVLIMTGVGLFLAALRPRPVDVTFFCWLAVVGIGIVRLVEHTEARYLLPVAPPLFYFAGRAIEVIAEALAPWWSSATARARAVAAAGMATALGAGVWAGVAQAAADQDRAFTTDRERKAVDLLERSRRGSGKSHLLGEWHTVFPAHPGPLPQDEYWNSFHFARHGVEYLRLGNPVADLGRPTFPPEARKDDLPAFLHDGDSVLRLDNTAFTTAQLPRSGAVGPMEVWSIRRIDLARKGEGLESADGRTSGRLEVLARRTSVSFVPESMSGSWWLYEQQRGNAKPKLNGLVKLVPGQRIPLALPHDDLTGVVLLAVDRQPVP